MHNDILDHEENPSDTSYYEKSKKNFLMALGLIFLVAIIIYFSFIFVGLNTLVPIMVGVIIIIAMINSFKGVYNGIQSYKRKEKNTAGKAIVLIGNITIAGLFIFAITMNIMDLARAFLF